MDCEQLEKLLAERDILKAEKRQLVGEVGAAQSRGDRFAQECERLAAKIDMLQTRLVALTNPAPVEYPTVRVEVPLSDLHDYKVVGIARSLTEAQAKAVKRAYDTMAILAAMGWIGFDGVRYNNITQGVARDILEGK